MRYISPYILTSNNINPSDNSIANFSSVIKSEWLKGVSITNITSTSGMIFTHLARSGDQNMDIQEDIISKYYGSGFDWETWPNESSFGEDQDLYPQTLLHSEYRFCQRAAVISPSEFFSHNEAKHVGTNPVSYCAKF